MQAIVSMGVVLSGGSIIDLDGTFFIQIGIFFLAFFILKGLVFGPVMKVIDAREAAVFGARRDADAMTTEVAEKKAHFEAQLRKVREEASKERDLQRAEAQKAARELTDKVRKEVNANLIEARERLAKQASEIRGEAQAQVPVLAKQIAAKMLNRSVH